MCSPSRVLVLASLFILSTYGHSELRCAKYNSATGDCDAPIRGEGYAFMQEAYDLSSGSNGICQYPWVNPISSYYNNGASCYDWAPCPDPMGSYTPGEQFTIMWFARNHATSDQTPGNVYLYLSPIETQNQGSDVSMAVMKQTLICQAPYMSCGGLNGNTVPCTTTCTFPSVPSGLYTLWWLWDWTGHDQYSTCADIMVIGGSSSAPTPAPTPTATTGNKVVPSTTGKTIVTTGKVPSTTGKVAPVPSTTGKINTTGKVAPLAATTGKVTPPVAATTAAPSSSTSCTVGQRKCLTSETYQTCTNGRDSPYWATAQSCQAGTTCHSSGDQIYCY